MQDQGSQNLDSTLMGLNKKVALGHEESSESEAEMIEEPTLSAFSPLAARENIPKSLPSDRIVDFENKVVSESLPKYDKRFRYETCATNLTHFPSLEYTQCDGPPYCARLNAVEKGQNTLIIDNEEQIVTTKDDTSFGSAKGNVCMKGGSWYFEIELLKPKVRIGIARREASCESPVGCNAYGYGIEDREGLSIHCGRVNKFMEPLSVGDVVGFHVNIPIDSRPRRVNRTRIPVKVGKQLWFESLNYRTTHEMLMWESNVELTPPPNEEVIDNSFVKVYRNGECAGTLAEPLRDFRPPNSEYAPVLQIPSSDDGMLGYYPMISAFEGGSAKLNCGPNFKYRVPEGARGLFERYDEQVADDFLLDLTEEIVFEAIDERLPKLQRRKLSEFKERKGTKINPFE